MIAANNVGSITRTVTDKKKGNVDFVKKFSAIGIIDDFQNNKDSHNCKLSDQGRIRTLSVQSARKKIELLRQHSGSLINASSTADENNLDNVFTTSSNANQVYSLSLYNRSNSFVERQQKHAVQQTWMRSVENLQPVPEEPGAPEAASPAKGLPDFQLPADLKPVAKDSIEAYKLQQMIEVESIKTRLDQDNCPQSVAVIARAVIIPEKLEFNPETRKYPSPEDGLMINPFPKKKATKGKKKKGKK